MLVMSSNLCCWGNWSLCVNKRMPRILEVFEKYNADFICVQECTEAWFDFLRKNLNGYGCIGIGRDENGTGEASCIFYKLSDYEILENQTFWLSATPEKISFGWDAMCRRICTYGLFKKISTEKKLMIFNTHLDHIGAIAQENGAKLITEKMVSFSAVSPTMPLILTGDFNISCKSIPYSILCGSLIDTHCAAKNTETFGTWHNFGEIPNMEKELPIDHIFVSRGTSVSSYQIIKDKVCGKYISDHYPILAEIIV